MASFSTKTKGLKLPLLAVCGLVFALITVLTRQPAPAQVPVTTPPTAPFQNSVSGVGVVEPKSEVIAIGTEISGVVRHVAVHVGDMVKAGDPLFTLDTRDTDARIKTLAASLVAVKIQAQDASASYDLVRNVTDKRAVATDLLDRRKFAAQLAAARVDEIVAQLQQAQTTKARQTIKAPINGQILFVNVRPGEFASAGNNAEALLRLGDMSQLRVRVEIDEENAAHITPTAVAKGSKRGDPSNQLLLEFVRFEPYVRAKQNLAVSGQRVDTRVLQVIYALPATDTPFFVGEQMDVFIETAKDK